MWFPGGLGVLPCVLPAMGSERPGARASRPRSQASEVLPSVLEKRDCTRDPAVSSIAFESR